MKTSILLTSSFFLLTSLSSLPAGEHRIWDDRPAKDWNGDYPVGNGWMGAMVDAGGVTTLQLNQYQVWKGKPHCYDVVVCENGVCRLVPDEVGKGVATAPADASVPAPTRIAQGMMDESAFLGFLSGEAEADPFAGKSIYLVLLLAVLGGFALNLTPCVLPMVPVNLLVIGASVGRGLLYGLGQFLAFGCLGLAAAVGGSAFGTIQSSPVFNLAVAVLFAAFALALAGAFPLDFSRFRKRGAAGAFVLGAVSALLAGACVAPVLVSVLLLSARLTAEGSRVGLLLPFAVAFGLALPWPFLGAGLKILPKPGGWMRWVNRAFAVFIAVLAVHYLILGVKGLRSRDSAPAGTDIALADVRARLQAAAAPSQPLLVFLHAPWCKNCPAMERLMAESPRVREALAPLEVVRVRIDTPGDLRALPGLEAVKGLPAFVLYDRSRGK